MTILQKTVWVTSAGRFCDSEEEARRVEAEDRIMRDLLLIHDEDGEHLFNLKTAGQVVTRAPEICLILRRHLDPEEGGDGQPVKFDEARTCDLLATLVTVSGCRPRPSNEAWLTIQTIVSRRMEVIGILQATASEEPAA